MDDSEPVRGLFPTGIARVDRLAGSGAMTNDRDKDLMLSEQEYFIYFLLTCKWCNVRRVRYNDVELQPLAECLGVILAMPNQLLDKLRFRVLKIIDAIDTEILSEVMDEERQAFSPTNSPTLPPDAANSLQELTKSNLALITEKKNSATKNNDIVYHDTVPQEGVIPPIEKLNAVKPIPIQELYNNPK
ncbi:4015_t:CDS:2, partial [Dentiscutata heterogama]